MLTLFRASAGHGLNQSMVQQLMSDGNWRQRARNDSPTGLMASTMCRWSRTRLMNADHMASRVSAMPCSVIHGLHGHTVCVCDAYAQEACSVSMQCASVHGLQ